MPGSELRLPKYIYVLHLMFRSIVFSFCYCPLNTQDPQLFKESQCPNSFSTKRYVNLANRTHSTLWEMQLGAISVHISHTQFFRIAFYNTHVPLYPFLTWDVLLNII
jgi:hypothetical protein